MSVIEGLHHAPIGTRAGASTLTYRSTALRWQMRMKHAILTVDAGSSRAAADGVILSHDL
jgi:hypothetical protein